MVDKKPNACVRTQLRGMREVAVLVWGVHYDEKSRQFNDNGTPTTTNAADVTTTTTASALPLLETASTAESTAPAVCGGESSMPRAPAVFCNTPHHAVHSEPR